MSQAVAEAGNAELAPGTAPDLDPQQQPEVPDEVAAPENVGEAEPETEGSEGSPESAPPPDPFAGLDDDTLLGHERVSALLRERVAKEAEAERRRGEAQTAQRIREQVNQYVQQGNLVRDLNAQVMEVINRIRPKLEAGEPIDSSELAVPAQSLSSLSNALYSYVNNYNATQWEGVMEALAPLANLPEPAREKIDRAAIAMQAGRGTVGDYMQARMESAIEAEIAKREPEMRKRWAAEQAKTAKKEADIDKQRAADAARNESNAPSIGQGANGQPRSARDILNDPKSSLKAKQDAFQALYKRPFEPIR